MFSEYHKKYQLQFSSDLLRSLPSSIQGKRGGASIIRPRSISLGAMCEGQEPSKSLPGQKQMVSRLFGTLQKKRNISVQSASGLPGDSRDVRCWRGAVLSQPGIGPVTTYTAKPSTIYSPRLRPPAGESHCVNV